LKEAASEPISSLLLLLTSSGVLSLPKLTTRAMSDIALTGFTTINRSNKSTSSSIYWSDLLS
jgi:hypothetical protein